MSKIERATAWGIYDCLKCGGMLTIHPRDEGKPLHELLCPVCKTPIVTKKIVTALVAASA